MADLRSGRSGGFSTSAISRRRNARPMVRWEAPGHRLRRDLLAVDQQCERGLTVAQVGGSGRGVELVEVSMLLGHPELRVTADLYSHLQKQTAARAARRMDAVLSSWGGVS